MIVPSCNLKIEQNSAVSVYSSVEILGRENKNELIIYLTFATTVPLIATASTDELCRTLVTTLTARWAVSVICVIPGSHGKPRISLFDYRGIFLPVVLERKMTLSNSKHRFIDAHKIGVSTYDMNQVVGVSRQWIINNWSYRDFSSGLMESKFKLVSRICLSLSIQ